MKKVLLIAYHYPPNPAVGGVRPSKFARYLPAFGWEPTVLTVAPRGRVLGERLHELAPVCRIAEWPHPLKTYERVRERRGGAEQVAAKTTLPYAVCQTPPREGLGLKRWLLTFLSLPDREMGWLVPAILRGRRLIARHHIRYLITTGPPFTCHVAGLILKRLTGVRWVADFRDPWSLAQKYPLFRNGATDFIETRLIRSVLRRADLILSVTPHMTRQAIAEHREIPVHRFQTLTSGFDPADFADMTWLRPLPDPVIFSYFGTFYHGRTPEPFLSALRALISEGSVKARDVTVNFVGQVTRADGRSVADMIRELGLDGVVTLKSAVSRHEALRQTLESHVVLVLDEQHPIQIPLKLYEALGAGATVLNIGSSGAVSEVLAKTGRGLAVHHRDPAAIKDGIVESIRRSRSAVTRSHHAPWDDDVVREYNFRGLTSRLAGLLNSL